MTIKNIAFSTNQLKNTQNKGKNLSFGLETNKTEEIFNKLTKDEKQELHDFVFCLISSAKNSYDLLKQREKLTKDEIMLLRKTAIEAKAIVCQTFYRKTIEEFRKEMCNRSNSPEVDQLITSLLLFKKDKNPANPLPSILEKYYLSR